MTGDYSCRHPYKYLIKLKGLIHYFNFVADDTKPNDWP